MDKHNAGCDDEILDALREASVFMLHVAAGVNGTRNKELRDEARAHYDHAVSVIAKAEASRPPLSARAFSRGCVMCGQGLDPVTAVPNADNSGGFCPDCINTETSQGAA